MIHPTCPDQNLLCSCMGAYVVWTNRGCSRCNWKAIWGIWVLYGYSCLTATYILHIWSACIASSFHHTLLPSQAQLRTWSWLTQTHMSLLCLYLQLSHQGHTWHITCDNDSVGQGLDSQWWRSNLCPMCCECCPRTIVPWCLICSGVLIFRILPFHLTHLYQYTLMVTNRECAHNHPTQVRQIFYSQLESILDVFLPPTHTLDIMQPKHFLLALVTLCSTRGKDATCDITTYEDMTRPVIINIRTIECVVGHVQRGNTWRIIDCSGDFARSVCGSGGWWWRLEKCSFWNLCVNIVIKSD